MGLFGSKKLGADRDWVTEATDHIERLVDGVRDKAVVPLTTIARAIVYGLFASILGVVGLVLVAVLVVRLLDVYLDNIPGAPENVWLAHLVAGSIFVIAGLLLWQQRSPKSAEHSP